MKRPIRGGHGSLFQVGGASAGYTSPQRPAYLLTQPPNPPLGYHFLHEFKLNFKKSTYK